MKISATKLRENIYSILDQILKTGVQVEIERKGAILRIIAPGKRSKIARLKKRRTLNCNPEELVHVDWSGEWSELK